MNKYSLLLNSKELITTLDFNITYRSFLDNVKNLIQTYSFSLFGELGLPYSLEAYLCMDDKFFNDENAKAKADEILNLFRLINQLEELTNEEWSKLKLQNISYSKIDDEWDFNLVIDKNEAILNITSGKYYLKANIFSNKNFKENLYFNFFLYAAVSNTNKNINIAEESKIDLFLIIEKS